MDTIRALHDAIPQIRNSVESIIKPKEKTKYIYHAFGKNKLQTKLPIN